MEGKIDSKFEVVKSAAMGRYAIATKDLTAGELIHTEEPFVVGPKCDSEPVCLECFSPINGLEGGPRCSNCFWPLCTTCQRLKTLKYHSMECPIFKASRVKFQNGWPSQKPCAQMDCITPLRLLLMIESRPEKWHSEVCLMEYHEEARKNSEHWMQDSVNIVNYLHDHCKLHDRFSREMIERAIGILEINVFEARTVKGFPLRCLYPLFGVVAHSCVPNTTHTISASDGFRFKAYATVSIADKSPIFATYTFSLSTTSMRQQHLKKSKYFTCACQRCQSPTELDTHLSSFKCLRCDDGVVLPNDPLKEDADWICNSCSLPRYGPEINRTVVVLQREISETLELEPDWVVIQELECLYDAFGRFLHENHFTLQTIKLNLIELYSSKLDLMDQNSEFLLRMVGFCESLLKILTVIEPGKTRFRAELLFYQHKPKLILIERQFKSGEIDCTTHKKLLMKLAGQLIETVEILKKEDPHSKEAKMGVEAQNSLNLINSKLKEIQNS